MNDDELRAWHQAQADQRHAVHLESQRRAHEQATRPPVNPQVEIQRAQQAYWDHEARTRRPEQQLLSSDWQHRQNPSQRTQAQLAAAHQEFLNTRYGYTPPARVDPGRYPQAQPAHHWWQVWKR